MECAETRQGRRIYVDPADPRGAQLIAAGGDLNPRSLMLWNLALGLQPWTLVLDIGVNYGEMLVGADLPTDARVIGFEPNTALHPFLVRTLDEAGVEIELRSEALSDAPGTARFAVDATWSGTSSLLDDRHDDGERWRFTEVTKTTLDDVIGAGNDFCAKVDVEGFEREVVVGGRRALASTAHWALMLEVAHISRAYLAQLAEEHPVFLMDPRTERLIRLPGGNAQLAGQLLASTWLHTHDCLVVSSDIARELENPA
ncbi:MULTISPECIES: FkbM family methyltransferase [Nocardioides]|uniref:FkbM family methyltransferase n=1 Tax=Nocardioides vastitatis TaxID=2568655 RepID=A0ABW0ZG19_9ACTN|nr:FkbM family methyltransferase [Nocardioides sp.]THJ08317.1 FkbM family methyltransferase [Nocardioides sp.]